MKLNNKGMTLVELLVTFSLLLVIVVGMFNLIMEVKFELDDKRIIKDFTEYSATINNDIHYNLLRDKPFAILIKSDSELNSIEGKYEWNTCNVNTLGGCECNKDVGCVFKSNQLNKSVSKSFNELDDMCQNIFPCAVYFYKDGEAISNKAIALNIAGTNIVEGTNDDVKDLLNKHGIYYKGVFESIPNQDYISSDINAEMKMTPEGVFVIEVSYSLIEHDKNNGFKIAYPFK